MIGVAASILCATAALVSVDQLLQSYLVAYVFWLQVGVGCLSVAMLRQMVGGQWGKASERLFEAGAATLPLLLLLLLPLLLGLQRLYPWARMPLPEFWNKALALLGLHTTYGALWPTVGQPGETVMHNAPYLNVAFVLLRTAVIFAAWIVLATLLNRWSSARRRTDDRRLSANLQRLSAGGMVVVALTFTFFAIDWVMSLEPEWYSTIFGGKLLVGGALSGFALVVSLCGVLKDEPRLDRLRLPGVLNDLGNLLLAFLMIWAYFAFSQYLIIWSGDLPAEVVWYAHRLQHGWQWLAVAIILLHFAVPFVAFLSRDVKQNGRALGAIACGLLVMHYVYLFWTITPAFSPASFRLHWLDVATPVAVSGIWLYWFARQIRLRLDAEADSTAGDAN